MSIDIENHKFCTNDFPHPKGAHIPLVVSSILALEHPLNYVSVIYLFTLQYIESSIKVSSSCSLFSETQIEFILAVLANYKKFQTSWILQHVKSRRLQSLRPLLCVRFKGKDESW